ncbi:MAG: hypothetical protein P9F75_00760 [Candidatus Contendobacter sp.]|nr:hypothetical protein [Candidatus Contendobacter sp.]
MRHGRSRGKPGKTRKTRKTRKAQQAEKHGRSKNRHPFQVGRARLQATIALQTPDKPREIDNVWDGEGP